MKTQVAVYDPLGSPSPLAWLNGYDQLLILVKMGRRPLGLVRMTSRDAAIVPRRRILQEIEHQFGHSPASLEAMRSAGAGEPAARPSISVIVCTRDRPQQLRRCLDSLGHLVYDAYEVIVVDSASRGDVTKRIVKTTPFRYVREDVPGLDRARNRGLACAEHDIVAYVDDDVVVDPHWLAGIAEGFQDPSVSTVTGLVLPLELETRAQHLFEGYGNGMNKGMHARSFQREGMSFQDIIETHWVGVGANMAFRRDVLRGIGGFDEALDVSTAAGGCGDLDAFHRIIMRGSVLRYEPSALAWHRHRPRMRQLRQQLHTNGRSYGVYLMKRWHEGHLSRPRLAKYVVWRWGRWLVGRVALGLIGRHRLPLQLLWAELYGALEAPRTYLTSYRSTSPRDGAAQSAQASTPPPRPRAGTGEPISVSVIIPAHNAASTLGEALESLLTQTHGSWQAIVADDGSTDATADVASSYAARDGRFELLRRKRGGAGAARNAGLKRARHDWLLFLDADDWLDPRHLERLTARAQSQPELDVVHCGWASLTGAGEVVEEGWPPGEGNLFDHFARYCAIPNMSAIVRRRCVEDVGGFDDRLRTCQDWDLWQRLARSGDTFGAVYEILAYYRLRQDSSSADERRVLPDGLRVIRRGHARDERIKGASPPNGNGRPSRWLAQVELYWVCWAAGLALGHGRAPIPLLAEVAEAKSSNLDPEDVADCLYRSVLRAMAEPPSSWQRLYPRLAPQLSDYLAALEAHSGTPGLARQTLFNIERRATRTPNQQAHQERAGPEAG